MENDVMPGSAWTLQLPTAAQIVETWERGAQSGPARRALALLAAGLPGIPDSALERLPVGRRDALLFTLRERLFGPELTCVSECPACREKVEIVVTTHDLRLPEPAGRSTATQESAPQASSDPGGTEPPEPDLYQLSLDGMVVKFRLPEVRDLIRIEDAPAGGDPARTLALCCIREICGDHAALSPGDLSDRMIEAIATRMAEIDPQADIQLLVECPICRHGWPAIFDIASYLWTEVDRYAQRLFAEVHTIAIAYGWQEADILAMSAVRRGRYLALLDYEP